MQRAFASSVAVGLGNWIRQVKLRVAIGSSYLAESL
jgi:hypothetical protein